MALKDELKKLVGVPIVINDVNYANSYADDLAVDRTDLESEFIQHTERYAYYATLAEMAEDRTTRLKENLETLAAKIDAESRAKSEAIRAQDPKFKMTEAMFEHQVRLDERYQAALKELQDARHLAKVLKCAPMAFAHRRDMLIELAKVHNAGMYDPRIRSGNADQVRSIIGRNRAANAGARQAPGLPAPSDEEEPFSEPTGTLCSVCHSPQFRTNGGEVCENGHGGAPALEAPAERKFSMPANSSGFDMPPDIPPPTTQSSSTTQSNTAPARRRAPRT